MKIFNKLVRDKIPEIIKKSGGKPFTVILSPDEYSKYLNEKLLEECNELINATDNLSKTEELADVLEVIYSIAKFSGISLKNLEEVRKNKKNENGGFESRIFLKHTN